MEGRAREGLWKAARGRAGGSRQVHGVIDGHPDDHHDEDGDVGVELEPREEGRREHPHDQA